MKSAFIPSTLLMATLTVGAFAADPPAEWDGLQKTKVKGVDQAYVLPGVDLSKYGKVMLDPVEVSFAKDWKPQQVGSNFDVKQADRDRIKKGISELAAKTFADTLSKKDGYPVVTEPGPDVMRLKAVLKDVYINAPDVPQAGRSKTYVMNAGSMTLVAELYDSETGALFARVVDKDEARDYPTFQYQTSVENTAEARAMVAQWAKILRTRLDAVRAKK